MWYNLGYSKPPPRRAFTSPVSRQRPLHYISPPMSSSPVHLKLRYYFTCIRHIPITFVIKALIIYVAGVTQTLKNIKMKQNVLRFFTKMKKVHVNPDMGFNRE